jgi:16S rRNA (guanine527-N7)-methyltransferase
MTDQLGAVLDESRRLGFLGPGPVEQHVEHATAYLDALGGEGTGTLAVDLGSGGGVPGLVMAVALPGSTWLLLDANQRRTAFLRAAVEQLGVAERVSVQTERAEVAGRSDVLRGGADVVVARSFSAPPVTAECAAPFLRVGGRLIVSEPPAGSSDRWDEAGLADLGLVVEERIDGPPRLVRIRQATPCPARFPRRTGVPGKRPLW